MKENLDFRQKYNLFSQIKPKSLIFEQIINIAIKIIIKLINSRLTIELEEKVTGNEPVKHVCFEHVVVFKINNRES